MKLLFDDVMLLVEGSKLEKDIKCSNFRDYDEVVRRLLTEEQYDKFLGFDTARTFAVSDKKVEAVLEFLKTKQLNNGKANNGRN